MLERTSVNFGCEAKIESKRRRRCGVAFNQLCHEALWRFVHFAAGQEREGEVGSAWGSTRICGGINTLCNQFAYAKINPKLCDDDVFVVVAVNTRPRFGRIQLNHNLCQLAWRWSRVVLYIPHWHHPVAHAQQKMCF